MNLDLDKGGRAAIERMIDAYGCGTKTALAELLGISKGTLSNRFLRDTFPADYVIQCALETGVSLEWLATGAGNMFTDIKTDLATVPRKILIDGKLFDSNYYVFDKAFLPEGLKKPEVIIDNDITYLMENSFKEIFDGKWLVEIEGKKFIRNLIRMPVGKIQVISNDAVFDCRLEDILIISKVSMICTTL